jgi:hypothetical protein
MRRQVEAWRKSELTDVAAKVVIYEAFVEGKWEAAKHLAQTGRERYFEPKYEEFKPRTIWSLSNAFAAPQLRRNRRERHLELAALSGPSRIATPPQSIPGNAGIGSSRGIVSLGAPIRSRPRTARWRRPI